jgi:DnaJ-class molecular chaperone
MQILLMFLILLGERECRGCHGAVVLSPLHREVSCSSCHPGVRSEEHRGEVPRADCTGCHKDIVRLYISSVHGKASKNGDKTALCQDCHGDHNILQASDPNSLIFGLNIPKVCGACHPGPLSEYEEGIHWIAYKRGNRDAALCTDCHGKHAIFSNDDPNSTVFPANIPNTCVRCHGDVRLTSRYGLPRRRGETYFSSYHGIVLKEGVLTAAHCASCHGAHRILPSSDPKSSTNKNNLLGTCGKCHPGATPNFVRGKIHVEPKKSVSPGVFYVRLFYTVFIGVLLFFFILHIIFDFRKHLGKV